MTDGATTVLGRIASGIDQILSRQGADGIALAIAKFVPGGLPALLDRLREAGHGAAVDSWLGSGRNEPVPAEALAQVMPARSAEALARDLRVPPGRLPVALAEFLPAAVDRESPDGQLRAQPGFDATRILEAQSHARRISA